MFYPNRSGRTSVAGPLAALALCLTSTIVLAQTSDAPTVTAQAAPTEAPAAAPVSPAPEAAAAPVVTAAPAAPAAAAPEAPVLAAPALPPSRGTGAGQARARLAPVRRTAAQEAAAAADSAAAPYTARTKPRPITTGSVAQTGAAAGTVGVASKGGGRCTRLAFEVNDYGKDGPTKDAQALLDKHIASWAQGKGIKSYKVGKKVVNCRLFLDFGVFDEHTCRAEAPVCW